MKMMIGLQSTETGREEQGSAMSNGDAKKDVGAKMEESVG